MLKINPVQALAGMTLLFMSVLPSDSQTLFGGVAVNDQLDSSATKFKEGRLIPVSDAKYDQASLPFKRDCICFDLNKVQLKQVDGNWKLVEGKNWILDFAQREDFAHESMKVMKRYNLNELCFVGRQTSMPMMYMLASGKAPEQASQAEADSVPFNLNEVKAEQINGSWKLTCQNMWMEDFGANEGAARDAEAILKYYGFKNQCYVGRPGAPFEYFTK